MSAAAILYCDLSVLGPPCDTVVFWFGCECDIAEEEAVACTGQQ